MTVAWWRYVLIPLNSGLVFDFGAIFSAICPPVLIPLNSGLVFDCLREAAEHAAKVLIPLNSGLVFDLGLTPVPQNPVVS